MKNKLNRIFTALTLLALITLNSRFSAAQAQGTAFTYQGQLDSGGEPANGFYDMRASVWNEAANGMMLSVYYTNLAVGVTNGLFTMTVDFGPGVFAGAVDWLQIGVRTNGAANFLALSPRQQLTPTPYAITAETLTGPIPAAQLPAGVLTNEESGVTLTNITLGGTLSLAFPAEFTIGGLPFLYGDSNFNYFAGENAGFLSAEGQYNTGVGTGTLHNCQTGSFNTGFGADALLFTTTGSYNTGIGYLALSTQTAPGYLVAGDNTAAGAYALYSDNTGSNNTGLGYGALMNVQSGLYNTALGYNAGVNITGNSNIDIGHPGVSGDSLVIRIGSGQTQTYIAGVINGNGSGLTDLPLPSLISDPGSENFFAGQNSGNPAITGSFNTGVGYAALDDITAGGYNTGTGYDALMNNTVGSANTAYGVLTLWKNTNGGNNTALGSDALAYNLSGNANTGVGQGAIENNTTGTDNTAVGSLALNNSTTGGTNTAVGFSALEENLAGIYSTAIGAESLQTCSDGIGNTAIGYQSFVALETGFGNIAVGQYAGSSLTSGFGDIYIGNDGLASENDTIRIGAFQSTTYIAGNVGLGGATPQNTLSLNGGLNIDQSSLNTGTVSANALTFGSSSGEGIGSVRTSGYSDSYGLNFYTDFNNRMTILQNGDVGIGTTSPTTALEVNGQVSCCSMQITGGCDLAEPFPVSPAAQALSEGAVVVIDEANPGHLKMADGPYDTRVAGVISGANGIHPGIQMLQTGALEGGRNVALTGRVYVQADASNGAIRPGDLLTTSTTPGRAMKVTDHLRAQGAILGKAMTGLAEGNGMVLVLVTLQ